MTSSSPGPWTLGKKYKWINAIAIVWVLLYTIIGSLPFVPEARVLQTRLQLVGRQLRAVGPDRRDGSGRDLVARVGKHTFTGPVRTIDELDREIALPEVAQYP